MNGVLLAAAAPRAPASLSRRLMVGGLALWGAGLAVALAPWAVRAVAYPNRAEQRPFDLVAGAPLASPFLFMGLAIWCVSWAFVAGYLATAWTARKGRPSWATPALLLSSLASPLVFSVSVPLLLRVATRDAYHADAVSYLVAVALQLVASQAYHLVLTTTPPLWPAHV